MHKVEKASAWQAHLAFPNAKATAEKQEEPARLLSEYQ